jgi:hypothetical protein
MEEKVKHKDADSQASDKDLEEGLEETFPASDPPASVQPGGERDTPPPKEK